MAILYFVHRKDQILFSPQYTRVRHRYRGPRESYKNNLEQSQIRFMIHKLYKAYDDFRADFLAKYTQLYEGYTFASITPTELPGLDELTQELQSLQNRVKTLEQNRTA